MHGLVGRSSAKSSLKMRGKPPVIPVCVCAEMRCSNSCASSYTKLSKICSSRVFWHICLIRGRSPSIQALTIASSASILSPHSALSKPLNLYTIISFRPNQGIANSFQAILSFIKIKVYSTIRLTILPVPDPFLYLFGPIGVANRQTSLAPFLFLCYTFQYFCPLHKSYND